MQWDIPVNIRLRPRSSQAGWQHTSTSFCARERIREMIKPITLPRLELRTRRSRIQLKARNILHGDSDTP